MWPFSINYLFLSTRFYDTHSDWHGSSLVRLKSEMMTSEDIGGHVLLGPWRVCLFGSLVTQLEYVSTFESGVVIDVILSKWLRSIWKLHHSCVHTWTAEGIWKNTGKICFSLNSVSRIIWVVCLTFLSLRCFRERLCNIFHLDDYR